jgi:hypothetical protein
MKSMRQFLFFRSKQTRFFTSFSSYRMVAWIQSTEGSYLVERLHARKNLACVGNLLCSCPACILFANNNLERLQQFRVVCDSVNFISYAINIGVFINSTWPII